MDSRELKVDNLPVEILQRVASYLPATAALRFLRVNRSIYKACNDRQVFKAIVNNRNAYDGPIWTTIPLSADSPTSAWARYAVADLKARRWRPERHSSPTIIRDVVRWAPQLMSAGRKCTAPYVLCVS